MRTLAVVLTLALVPFAHASATVKLTWIPGSTVKVEQLIGDRDYTALAKTGQCTPTTSRTITRARVVGTDLGSSFESDGKLVFLFGDTIGPDQNYFASDTMASTTSTDPAAGLFLDFFTNSDGSPYFIRVPGIRMGAHEVPEAGIRIGSTTYIICKTGVDMNLPDAMAKAYSVLTTFEETTRRFTLLRTVSSMPSGRFISVSLHDYDDEVLMYGLGAYRASDVYLLRTPASSFSTGAGTRYFAGWSNGQPAWSASEADAVPVLVTNPPAGPPVAGNVSVIYSEELDLWLMTYDGRQSSAAVGVFFSYAREPWGPWSEPQLIFQAKRDGALGAFIHDPTIVPNPPGDGLNGPTIGGNDPYTTPGATYGPFLIERFTRADGKKLSIYYIVSTWNPYTIVEMRSDFTIERVPSKRRAARH